VIAATEAFRLASSHPDLESAEGAERVTATWGAFPLTRLSPDQMIGAMGATTSLQTIERDSHVLTRTIRFFRETDFLREYGQVVDSQGGSLPATIPQALVQMNGKLAREMVEANVVTAMSTNNASTVFIVTQTDVTDGATAVWGSGNSGFSSSRTRRYGLNTGGTGQWACAAKASEAQGPAGAGVASSNTANHAKGVRAGCTGKAASNAGAASKDTAPTHHRPAMAWA
jgi:hypothetical protein